MVVFGEDGHGGLGVRTKKMCINVGNMLKKLKKGVTENLLIPKNIKKGKNSRFLLKKAFFLR